MAISLNNQGIRTPPKGGIGRSVHTFRRELFVKFRKSPHRTEKSLRHAQKPANPRSANPIGPESTSVTPGKDPPYGNPPPRAEKWRRRDPSRSLLRLAKVTQKRGFCRRFSGGFPAVFRRFPGGFPTVFSASSTPVSRRFGRQVRQRFDSHFPATRFPWINPPRPTPAPPLHPKETPRNVKKRRQFRTHFHAYKPSIAAFSKVCL